MMRASLTAVAAIAVSASMAAAASAKTLYVSKTGSDAKACTKKAPCETIGHAVAQAHRGDTVKVSAGTYAEMVTISNNISLVGSGATIDATGLANGVLIAGPHSPGAVVRGFKVENADFEGILAQHTSRLRIFGNDVRHNDRGMFAKPQQGECAPSGQIPGDCGEGVHLMSVTNSNVTGNLVTDNSGGILLSDELGPTAGNTIFGNRVLRNLYDCGITVAGHNPNAVSTTNGKLAPKTGGIYRNTISKNVSNGNGVKGEGAGILLAVAGPGAAVYDNVVQGNTANGNNLAGVTLHLHAPGSYLNGNKIIGNRLRNDGLGGDPDFGVKSTIGILVGSAEPLKGIVISANRISDVHFGIWTKNVKKIKRSSNKFAKNVVVPLTQF
jgi:parallel beta-helix repeat protein